MSMDWQQLASLFIVAAASAGLAGRKLRRRRFSFERRTACGCLGAGRAGGVSSLVFRARKGRRREVLVKMRP